MLEDNAPANTILVPLDGSARAEAALPIAANLARAAGSALLLVNVISPLTWAFSTPDNLVSGDVYQTLLEEEDRTAEAYLSHASTLPSVDGCAIRTLAMRGDVAPTLIAAAQDEGVRLIVLMSHERRGLARATLGSVIDIVVRESAVPVLILRTMPEEGDHPENAQVVRLEHALVPLDGSGLAEAALTVAESFAGTVIRRMRLIRVVPLVASDDEAGAAQRYLDEAAYAVRARLGGTDCEVQVHLARGIVDGEIVADAAASSDLIVMATHGQSGLRRLVLGSVAERVVHHARMPVLVVRP